MEDKNYWPLVHAFKKLNRRQLVPALTCTCGYEYTWIMGEEDEPTLKCWSCGTSKKPGIEMYRRIEAVVKEHNLEF